MLFARLDIEFHAIGDQVTDKAAIQIGTCGSDPTVIDGDGGDVSGPGGVADHHALDSAISDVVEKLGVRHRIARACAAIVELLEHRKQNKRDDKPDGGFGEDVIQSIYSFLDLAVYVISMTFATEGFRAPG